MSANQKIAILSVYDKTGLLDLAKGLIQQSVRILASGGTSRMIREAGLAVEYELPSPSHAQSPSIHTRRHCTGQKKEKKKKGRNEPLAKIK